MHVVDIDTAAGLVFVNAADIQRTKSGIVPLRFPRKTLAEFGKMAPIARFQAGIEIQLPATVRKVTFHLRMLDSDGYCVSCELYRGPHKILPTWKLNHETDQVQSHTFDTCTPLVAQDPLRLLLPTHSTVEVAGIEIDDAAAVDQNFEPYDYRRLPHANGLTWVVYGDSITHGASVVCPSHTWVDLVARGLGMRHVNLAIGGHGTAELPVGKYLASRSDADIMSLHMGVNAALTRCSDDYLERLPAFLDAIRKGCPVTPVMLCSPIYSDLDSDTLNGGRKEIDRLRKGMRNEVERRQTAGDQMLLYLDGRDLEFDDTLLLSDALHIAEAGACHYTAALRPRLQEMIAGTGTGALPANQNDDDSP